MEPSSKGRVRTSTTTSPTTRRVARRARSARGIGRRPPGLAWGLADRQLRIGLAAASVGRTEPQYRCRDDPGVVALGGSGSHVSRSGWRRGFARCVRTRRSRELALLAFVQRDVLDRRVNAPDSAKGGSPTQTVRQATARSQLSGSRASASTRSLAAYRRAVGSTWARFRAERGSRYHIAGPGQCTAGRCRAL